jgi:hypothetical protein
MRKNGRELADEDDLERGDRIFLAKEEKLPRCTKLWS